MFFVLLFILAFIIPLLGTGVLLGYVLRNLFQKRTSEFLQNEKLEMEQKVNKLKEKLESWKNFTPYDITNHMTYFFRKSMSNKLTGYIYSQNDSSIIAFQRIDRGIYTNSRIVACSTDFKIYYEYAHNEILVFYDDVYFGKIINGTTITNSLHVPIGICNRNNPHNKHNYSIEFGSDTVAELIKNSDRKNFVKNPFYKRPNSPYKFERDQLNYREASSPNSLVTMIETTNPEEIKWINIIGIFECIYYGFDFTS